MVSSSARFNTSRAAVAFDLALKRINSEPSLLNGYQLNLSTLIDDKVRILFTPTRAFDKQLYSVVDQQQCESS